MKVWDYNIPKNWKPQTDEGWIWYLEKMIMTGNIERAPKRMVKKYWPKLKLDEGNRLFLGHYLFGRKEN